MTAGPDRQIVFPLTDGVTETVVSEVAGGVITVSDNTRLTKLKGTLSRRPAVDTILVVPTAVPNTDSLTPCGGIIPGPGRSNLAIFPPETKSKRIFGLGTEDLRGTVTGTAGQNGYYPVRIDFAGAVDGGPVTETPATCIDNQGYQWTSSVRQTGDTTIGLFVSVYLNGATVVSSRKVFDLTTGAAGLFGLRFFTGITLAEFSVVLWFEQSTGIYAATATLDSSGLGLTVGAATLICLPQNPTAAPALYRPADVTSDRLSRAFLFTRSTANKTTVQIREVDQTTLTVTTTFTVMGTVGDTGAIQVDTLYLAVQYWPATDQITYAYSHNFGSDYTRFGVINRNTGATSWSDITTGDYGPCGIQLMTVDGVMYTAIASTQSDDVFTGQTYVRIAHRTLASNSLGPPDFLLYWYQLQSRGGYYVQDQSTFAEVYAYWSVMPSWGPLTQYSIPGSSGYVIDPSIEIITYGSGVYSPVARIGVDRASMRVGPRNGNSFFVHRDSAIAAICYSEKRYDIPRNPLSAYLNQDGARVAMLSMRPEHTRATQNANGVAFLAAAMPVAWDGTELVEAGPLHRMKVEVKTTGGAGPNITGTYSVVAQASFRDSTGNVHKSAPSLPFTVTLAGTKPVVNVTQPFTFRNGDTLEHPTISLFWTLNGGSIYYQQPPIVSPTWFNAPGYVEFSYIAPPTAVDGDRIPSTGADNEPLLPECPPPAWDMQTIDGRIWLIDAEDRNVVLPSLLKNDDQITYEFNSTMRIASFDPQYGKLIALAKYGETLVFAERCIWRVAGNGPNNSGQGQGFADPEIVAYVGCRNRSSVCQVPGIGILFQSDDGRMAMYAGSVTKFDTFGYYDVLAPTVHRQENEVIYPLSGGGFIVYNWLANAWTHWPSAVEFKAIGTVPGVTLFAGPTGESLTTRTYMYQDGAIVVMDSNSVDADNTNNISVERGWIVPGNPQDDGVIREVWIQGLSNGRLNEDGQLVDESGMTVEVSFDYNLANSVARSWTAAELYALGVLGGGKWTVGVNCHASQARAVNVNCTSVLPANSTAEFQPLTVTVVYAPTGVPRRRALKAGALK